MPPRSRSMRSARLGELTSAARSSIRLLRQRVRQRLSVLRGTIGSMSFVRDPLSVAYGEQTGLLLDRLCAATSLPASADALVGVPLMIPRALGVGRVEEHE